MRECVSGLFRAVPHNAAMRPLSSVAVLIAVLGLCGLGCGNPTNERAPSAPTKAQPAHGEVVEPPFAVRGELEGLLLVWFDEKGLAHTASKRAEVPEDARARVRIDSLDVTPERRLDPSQVYVADLRAAQKDGAYRVEKWSREAFEAELAGPAPELVAVGGANGAGVILYSASWCGACKQAAQFMTKRGVAFVEKDIEKEPDARQEMLQKARAQGVSTQGIPVIDVHGTLITGFDPERLGSLLDRAPGKPDQGT